MICSRQSLCLPPELGAQASEQIVGATLAEPHANANVGNGNVEAQQLGEVIQAICRGGHLRGRLGHYAAARTSSGALSRSSRCLARKSFSASSRLYATRAGRSGHSSHARSHAVTPI